MDYKDQYQHLLKSKGISLLDLGIQDIAFEREDALSAIQFLRKTMIPILGGDVYVKNKSNIELAYANWHSDTIKNEAPIDYLNRSWDTTENYIRNYPNPANGTPIFAFVIAI